MKSTCIFAATLLSISASWTTGQVQDRANEHGPSGASTTENQAAPAKTVFFLLAEFTQSINVSKLKAGDRIKAEVTQDVLWHGKIVIPVDSKLVGHVTEAKGPTAEDAESRLGIVFDQIIFKNHRVVSFQGVIQTLAAPAERRSRVDEPDQMLPPSAYSGNAGGNMGSTVGLLGHGNSGSSTGASGMSSPSLSGGPPVYVNGTPGSNVGNAAGADLHHPSGGGVLDNGPVATPLGAGMPMGIFGIKGLTLKPSSTRITPGPVIVSPNHTIKLEYGTQVLLKGTDPHVIKP